MFKFIETERRMVTERRKTSRMVIARAGRWENEELVFNGYQVSVGEDEKLLEMGSDDG